MENKDVAKEAVNELMECITDLCETYPEQQAAILAAMVTIAASNMQGNGIDTIPTNYGTLVLIPEKTQ